MQQQNATTALIDKITAREFNPLRTQSPSPDPQIVGFRAGLTKQLTGTDLSMPYRAGTAAAESYLAGKAEGREFNCPALIDDTEAASAQA